jgi:hypothetical protein
MRWTALIMFLTFIISSCGGSADSSTDTNTNDNTDTSTELVWGQDNWNEKNWQ